MKNSKKKKKPRKTQAQLDQKLEKEFESTDLSEIFKDPNFKLQAIRPKEKLISIYFPPRLIELLKAKGAKRGIGYQTMLKIIVHENMEKY